MPTNRHREAYQLTGAALFNTFRGQLPDGIRKSRRIFLGQVVPGIRNDTVLSIARESRRGGFSIRCRYNAVGISVHRDRWHADSRLRGKPLLEILILRVASGVAESVTIRMDHDIDVVGIVERLSAPAERRVGRGFS